MIWKKESTVSSVFTDSSVKLGIAQSFYLLQDGITECLGDMGFDGVLIKKKYNACWIVTRTKVSFIKRPSWNDKIIINSFPTDNTGARTHLYTEILGLDGKPLMQAVQEICLLNLQNHRLMRLSELDFPTADFPLAHYDGNFARNLDINERVIESYEQKIYSQHIDMSQHVNNVEYIKMALNLIPTKILIAHQIDEIEANFLGECTEGCVLNIERMNKGSTTFFRIKNFKQIVFEMKVTFVN